MQRQPHTCFNTQWDGPQSGSVAFVFSSSMRHDQPSMGFAAREARITGATSSCRSVGSSSSLSRPLSHISAHLVLSLAARGFYPEAVPRGPRPGRTAGLLVRPTTAAPATPLTTAHGTAATRRSPRHRPRRRPRRRRPRRCIVARAVTTRAVVALNPVDQAGAARRHVWPPHVGHRSLARGRSRGTAARAAAPRAPVARGTARGS